MQYLQAAFEAWQLAGSLRSRRERYKNFTYGRQWLDPVKDDDGKVISEAQAAEMSGARPMTNNLIRQLVKCITGNFRNSLKDARAEGDAGSIVDAEISERNNLDELDSRMLEEFLISGCAIQRIVDEQRLQGSGVWVDNVSPMRFFVNRFSDPRGHDIELIGMLHDYSLRELIMRYGDGSRARSQKLAKIYGQIATEGVSCGVGDKSRAEFFLAEPGRCRVIEVWTLESRNLLKCHDYLSGTLFLTPADERPRLAKLNAQRRDASLPQVEAQERISARWHCRCYAPSGELIDEYDSPYSHGMHPFAVKFYPLTDGEVHSFVEDIIDQQKHINRIITLIDHIMSTSAKGVLLFPTDRKPPEMSWTEVAQCWSRPGGVLPIEPSMRSGEPHQVNNGAEQAGAYHLLDLQIKMLQQVSGVNDALQGRLERGNASAALYETQVRNSAIAILDLIESFNDFRRKRDRLVVESNFC